MVITDATAGTKLARKVRKMSVVNYVPSRYGGSRNIPIVRIIEDPHGKNSAETLPIQMCDVAAYFLYQRYKPNAYVSRQKAERYFDRLSPVLNKHASTSNAMGIVVQYKLRADGFRRGNPTNRICLPSDSTISMGRFSRFVKDFQWFTSDSFH